MNIGENEEYCVPPEIEADEAERMRLEEEILEAEARREALPAPANPLLPAVAAEVKPSSPPTSGIDPKANRAVEVGEALLSAYSKSSTLEVNPEEERLLRKPFPDEDVEMRPDGLLYIPHILIRERLIDAFGAGKWSVIRRREWVDSRDGKEILYAEWVLLVRGVAVGETVTGHPLTGRMDYGDALESTEGEAVRRIAAKRFGCGSQVWSPRYSREWKAKQASKISQKSPTTSQTSRPLQPSAQPAKVAPEQSQMAKQAVPEPAPESPDQKLAAWKKMLEPLGQYAVDYIREKNVLLPNEDLSHLAEDKIPKTRGEARAIIEAIRLQMDGGMGTPPDPAPEPPQDPDTEIKPNFDNEPKHTVVDAGTRARTVVSWREAECPGIPKYKGKKLGELEKGELWWFCCKWAPKPWTDRQGQLRTPSEKDILLRDTLDAVKAFYEFKDKRP